MLSPNRTKAWLVAGLLTWIACTPVFAGDWFTLGDMKDLEFFAPPDVSDYGDVPRAKQGLFVSVDQMALWTQRPDPQPVGQLGADAYTFPGRFGSFTVATAVSATFDFRARGYGLTSTVDQTATPGAADRSSILTSPFASKVTPATRIEIGCVTDENGWMFGLFKEQDQEQYWLGKNVTVAFAGMPVMVTSSPTSPFPLGTSAPVAPTWENFAMGNRIEHWTTELLYLRRFKPMRYGGIFELYLGARYIEFNDHFSIEGNLSEYNLQDNSTDPAGRNVESLMISNASNRIIGPEIGLHYFRKKGRWMLSTEGRFVAGFNYKSYQFDGQLDTRTHYPIGPGQTPAVQATNQFFSPFGTSPFFTAATWTSAGTMQGFLYTPASSSSFLSDTSFVPFVEVRAELRYQLTKIITAHIGWNGMWMNGIGRASEAPNWTWPMTLKDNNQQLINQGVMFGLDLNR